MTFSIRFTFCIHSIIIELDESICVVCLHSAVSPNCTADSFVCRDYTCVPMETRCDGHDDCPDASDENMCGQYLR